MSAHPPAPPPPAILTCPGRPDSETSYGAGGTKSRKIRPRAPRSPGRTPVRDAAGTRRMTNRVGAPALLALVGLVLAGCGGGGGPSSFVGAASNAAVYVT